MIGRTGVTKRNDQNQFGISFNGNLDACAYTGLPESMQSNKPCSNYVKGYNDGYSSTCGKNPDGCNNILSAISPDPFYTSGWVNGNTAAVHPILSLSNMSPTEPFFLGSSRLFLSTTSSLVLKCASVKKQLMNINCFVA